MFNLKNLPYLVIIALVAVIFVMRCGPSPKPIDKGPDTIAVKTVVKYITVHDTVIGKPRLIKSEPDTLWRDTSYNKPDTSYRGLLNQYDALGDKYYSRHIYKTPYSLGKYGSAEVTDTVVANHLMGTSLKYDIVIPETTRTITIQEPYKPKNQFYLGGGINGNQTKILSSVELGVLFKNKKDQIFQGKVIQPFGAPTEYGVSTYFKIKF